MDMGRFRQSMNTQRLDSRISSHPHSRSSKPIDFSRPHPALPSKKTHHTHPMPQKGVNIASKLLFRQIRRIKAYSARNKQLPEEGATKMSNHQVQDASDKNKQLPEMAVETHLHKMKTLLERERHLLEKNAVEMSKKQRQYLAEGAKLLETYPSYPRHDDYKGYSKDAKDQAMEDHKSIQLRNEALMFLQLLALKQMHAICIADNPKFKAVKHMVLHHDNGENDYEKALMEINAINNEITEKDILHIDSGIEAHLILDINSGKLMVNGVCMDLKEIRSFKHDKETGTTTIVWREDIPEFIIYDQKEYTKRISSFEINTNNRTLSLKIDGNTYKNGERSKIILQDGDHKKEYDAKYLKKIIVSKHEKHEGDFEISYRVEVKTMPEDTIKHDEPLPYYSPEELAGMYRFNLRTNELILPNDGRVDILKIDGTETRMDPVNGPTLIFEGEYRAVCLKYAGTLSHFTNTLNKVKEEWKMRRINLARNCLEFLKQSIKTKNQSMIASCIEFIEVTEELAASETYAMMHNVKRPPKSKEDLKNMRDTSSDPLERISEAHLHDAQAMFQTRNAYDEALKQRLTAIYGEEYPSRKAKTALLDELNAAEHIQQAYPFQLLVDPNKGRDVKHTHPHALMLIEEYHKYAGKPHPTKEDEQYKQDLNNFIQSTDNDRLKNMIVLYDAVKAKDEGKLYDILHHIKNLRGGDRPLICESIDDLRQDCEYHWVKYLQDAVSRARNEGIPELILAPLSIAQHLQQSRLHNLRLAQEALDLGTSSLMAQRAISTMSMARLPLLMQDREEKPLLTKDELAHGKDAKNVELDTFIQDNLQKIIPEQFAEKGVKLAWKTSNEIYETLLNATSDPIRRKELEGRAHEMITEAAKGMLKTYAITLKMAYHQGNREKVAELMHKTMVHDIVICMFTNATFDLKQVSARVNSIVGRFLAEMDKVLS